MKWLFLPIFIIGSVLIACIWWLWYLKADEFTEGGYKLDEWISWTDNYPEIDRAIDRMEEKRRAKL